jgi:DNA topoisomerase-1
MPRITLTEKTILDPGYRAAYTPPHDDVQPAPRLSQRRRGERVRLRAQVRHQKGLAEGELIAQMQSSGVGRPSTYAMTLEALRRHGYIEEREGRLIVTTRGKQALAFLRTNYPFLLDADFTAHLEAQLDALAEGKTTYHQTIQSVWDRLQKQN